MSVVGPKVRGAVRRLRRLLQCPTARKSSAAADQTEGWRDRESGLASSLQAASEEATQRSRTKARSRKLPTFKPEQRVEHSHFGPGVITKIEAAGAEAKISVLFDASQERTFLMHLVADKLSAGA